MKFFLLTILFFHLYPVKAQELRDLSGEVDFPWINGYSVYGLDEAAAGKILDSYEEQYRQAQQKNELDYEMRMYALIKEKHLFSSPYVLIRNAEEKRIVVYMDSVSYARTLVWSYKNEELIKMQQFLWFEGKGVWLSENVYLLTEFKKLILKEDKSRSKSMSKLAMDVYRK